MNTSALQQQLTVNTAFAQSSLRMPGPDVVPGLRCSGAAKVLNDPLVVEARLCAHSEFRNKARKLPKGLVSAPIPYVLHLEEVAQTLATFGYSPQVVAAGYLHDHTEDLQKQGWTYARMSAQFGKTVADLVSWVTQQDKKLDWKERQVKYAERLKDAPDEAIAISLADKLSNINSLILWMQRGYRVDQIVSRGWKENSDKMHELMAIYRGRVPQKLEDRFRRTLRRFDRLGKNE